MKQLNWYQIFGNTHIIPDGRTVTPTDDIQTLLHCANIWDKSYTTIGEVIADDDTLFLTLIDNNAIDYLVRSTTFASSIVASESAMQYIGASDYASETLLSDSTWLTAIDGSAYKDYVANVSVPKMTSNTTPSGVASSSSDYDSAHTAYTAFDRSDSMAGWCAASGNTTGWLQYKFPISRKIYGGVITNYGSATISSKDFIIRSSTDGVSFTDRFTSNFTSPSEVQVINFASPVDADYFRAAITSRLGSVSIGLTDLQFYGRENAGVQTWLKAGGITNKKYTTVSEVLSDLTTLATLMSSTDAIDYLVTAKGWATEICSDSNAMADIGMNNYAANTLLADETWAEAIGNSTYFTSVLNVSVPAMTDNTHPYGECFASDVNSVAWKAFNGTNTGVSDMWGSDNAVPQSLGYKFTSPVRIAKVMIANRKGASPGYIHSVREFALEASNDGVTYTKIKDFLNTVNTQGAETYYSNAIGTTYTYYHINISSTNESSTPYIGMLQFYGRKDI